MTAVEIVVSFGKWISIIKLQVSATLKMQSSIGLSPVLYNKNNKFVISATSFVNYLFICLKNKRIISKMA